MPLQSDEPLGFTPSQRWRPTAAINAFPYCKLQLAQITAIRGAWINMGSLGDPTVNKFLNLHCLETNFMEGTVQFDESISFPFDATRFHVLIFSIDYHQTCSCQILPSS